MHKVLIINAALVGEQTGTGNTLNNIISGYPQDKLMQLCMQRDKEELNTTIENTIFISNRFCPLEYNLRDLVISKMRTDGAMPADVAAASNKSFKSSLHDCIRGFLDNLPVNYKDILDKTDRFSPDVIYTCGANIRIMKTANFLAKRYNARIILHLMDDWPETLYTTSFLSKPFRCSLLKQLNRINESSIRNFAISKALAQKYEQKYGKKYIPLMNPAKNIVSGVSDTHNKKVIFTYAGSLSLDRWKSLREIAQCLEELRNEGIDSEFHLYIPKKLNTERMKKIFDRHGAVLFDYVPADQVEQVYKYSDVLVIVESFEDNFRKYTKLSLSTKIPEYMAAGKPILAYLPEELHSSDYLKESGAALVANNNKELKHCIKTLLLNKKTRVCLAENGIKKALSEHSQSSAHNKFIVAVNPTWRGKINEHNR